MVVLIILLCTYIIVQESLKSANINIIELKDAYKNAVPRFEHELLQTEHDSYKSRFEQQREMTMRLHQQILDIQQKHDQSIRELEKRFAERLLHATPDWDFIAKRCTGNIEPYWTPCNGMNCNETIVTLIHFMLKEGGINSFKLNATTINDMNNNNDTATGRSINITKNNINSSRNNLVSSSGGGRTKSRPDHVSGGMISSLSSASLTTKTTTKSSNTTNTTISGFSLRQQLENEEKQIYFVGLGFSASVPRYLRWKGRIKNRKLTKRNINLLIRDIWTTKQGYDNERIRQDHPPSQLPEYFYQYLKKRFGSQELIAEWGYNVIEACKQYKERSCDCWLFLDILEGNLDITVYQYVHELVESVRNTFIRLDANLNDGIASGIVPKSIIISSLTEMWKHKVPSQLNELSLALQADQPVGDIITYSLLFQAANHGDSAFIEAIMMQEIEERAQYMKELESAVLQYHGATVTALTSLEFARVLGRFDVDKSKAEIDEYVARGYGVPIDILKPRDTITIGRFLTNLSRGVVKRG